MSSTSSASPPKEAKAAGREQYGENPGQVGESLGSSLSRPVHPLNYLSNRRKTSS